MSKWMVAVAGTAVLATACAQQYEPINRERDVSTRVRDNNENQIENGPLFSGEGFLNAVGGRLDGAIGNSTGLASEATSIDFYDDGYATNANIIARGPNGDAMGIISVVNGSIANLEEGDDVSTCQDDYGDPNSGVNNGEISAFVTGCAGPSMDTGWDYDAPADCVNLSVEAAGVDAPAGAVATVRILAHWSENSYGGLERTVKATLHVSEE